MDMIINNDDSIKENRNELQEFMLFEADDGIKYVKDGKTPKMFMSGVIQRANTPNHNKRIYPRQILEREDQKMQEAIKERRALGCLDHIDCLSPTAKILTKNGFKFIKDVDDNEFIYSLNIDTNKVELQQITEKIDKPYNGKMYRIHNRNLDTLVTPNHRFLLESRYGKRFFITAEELYKQWKNFELDKHHKIIQNVGDWSDVLDIQSHTFTLPALNQSDDISVQNSGIDVIHDYNDHVYCVKVPNQTFYCMDNGKCYWSGNSSVINLTDASHLFTKTWWNGDVLCGTVQILNTPKGKILQSLVEDNIKLGISSRGLGSTRKSNDGYDVVDEDFQLICYDFVSNPSTNGAYMSLQESKDYKIVVENNRKILLNNVVNDILRLKKQ